MWDPPDPLEPGAVRPGPLPGETPIATIERLAEELHGVPRVSGPTAKRRPDPTPFSIRLDEIWRRAVPGGSREAGEEG